MALNGPPSAAYGDIDADKQDYQRRQYEAGDAARSLPR